MMLLIENKASNKSMSLLIIGTKWAKHGILFNIFFGRKNIYFLKKPINTKKNKTKIIETTHHLGGYIPTRQTLISNK